MPTASTPVGTRSEGARAAGLGRREEQRLETVKRLEAGAFQVFIERGFDATTADQIAAAAGVSARTLYRHFPRGKQDIVLAEARRNMSRLADALATRPPHEPALAALRAAVRMVQNDGTRTTESVGVYATISRDHPELLAQMVGEEALFNETLVMSLALRMSADPATDVRPRLLVHAVHSASTVAWLTWLEHPEADQRALLESALDILEAGFAAACAGPAPSDPTAA
jgi:AcrR family transcriptional regulator